MTAKILQGDMRDRLAELPEQSVHMCVTSPPYWSLRKYEGAQDVDWADGTRCALGQESTPESYIAHLVECFQAVKRVLRDDGVLFVNIGDSQSRASGGDAGNKKNTGQESARIGGAYDDESYIPPPGCKPKDRIGIPWMLAFAMRADGWYWGTASCGRKVQAFVKVGAGA